MRLIVCWVDVELLIPRLKRRPGVVIHHCWPNGGTLLTPMIRHANSQQRCGLRGFVWPRHREYDVAPGSESSVGEQLVGNSRSPGPIEGFLSLYVHLGLATMRGVRELAKNTIICHLRPLCGAILRRGYSIEHLATILTPHDQAYSDGHYANRVFLQPNPV